MSSNLEIKSKERAINYLKNAVDLCKDFPACKKNNFFQKGVMYAKLSLDYLESNKVELNAGEQKIIDSYHSYTG